MRSLRLIGWVAVLYFVIGFVIVAAAKAGIGNPLIYLQTKTAFVTTGELKADAVPFGQSAQQYVKVWKPKRNRPIIMVGPPGQAPGGAWVMTVYDSNAPLLYNCGCYGYHDNAKKGLPYAVVGADPGDQSWQVTLSHELFEMLKDPYGKSFVKVGLRRYIVEIADPTEASTFAYSLNTLAGVPVWISDWVYPSWYRLAGVAPFDYQNKVTMPFQLLCDGYDSYKDSFGNWHQDQGESC